MSNRKLSALVELRDRKALATIRKALAKGNGVKAAALDLGVCRTTLETWGRSWVSVGALIDKHKLTLDRVAELGVEARGQKVHK